MALSQPSLKSSIQAVFDGYPDSTADAASGLADAYDSYASVAMFGPCSPTLTGKKEALAASLQASMNGVLATFCVAWATGVTAYWTGVAVAGPGQSGTTVPPPGATSIAASLQAALGAFPATTSDAAEAIASALHTATMTTTALVLIPPAPSPVVVPIV